jgi:hypothetical protein
MAMGVPEEGTEEAVEMMKLQTQWMEIPEKGKDKLTKRRKMRHNMFKIIKRIRRELEMTPELQAIKAIIDPQLDGNHQINWGTFTFHWDLHPTDHTKIIQKDRWFPEGGRYDELGALQPTAFTEQVID